jgi:hypothetical protein
VSESLFVIQGSKQTEDSSKIGSDSAPRRYDNTDGQGELVPVRPLVIFKKSVAVAVGGFYKML